RTPKSLTLEIYHGGWFTPTHYRSYIGGQVSFVNVVNIDEFCLHDLKDMVVKLGYGVEYLMHCHFLILSLGLDYGLHSLNVDVDVLEMSKYVKDYKIMLVYVEHGSSNVDTSMFNSSPDPASSVARPIVVESVVDPFDGLDDILGDYANIEKLITKDESTWKQMVVHVSTSSTTDDFSFEKFKEVEVEAYTKSEEEDSDTEGNDTSGSDSEDLDYDLKHDDVFDDDEHIGIKKNKQAKNKGPNKYYFYLGQQFASKEIMKGRVKKIQLRLETTNAGGPSRENINSGKHNILGKDKTIEGKGKKVITSKKVDKYLCPWTMLVTYTKECRWEVRTLIEDRTCIQSRAIKACTSRSLPGQILTAVRNNRIYPVAYVIVEAESKASCDLYEPLQVSFQVLNTAKATSEGELKKKMGVLKSFNSNAYDWLMKIPLEQQSRAYFLATIYNMSENSVGVGIPEQWVHAAYRLETWAHVYSFKVNPCKLSRKDKPVSCEKCGNVGHNRKGRRVQGGSSSQAGARKASGQAASSRKVSGQAAGARNVSGQVAGARIVFGQAAGGRKALSQPSAAQSTKNQGPKQGFQGPIAGPTSGSQR
nr:transposase, mutator type [Tanacetum cinerariifolium]GEY43042.1 transposase, mutator type [Tanacetum cinerariifolium]GEY48834.1 transposase, mutator type [Tanacetum cinerariifolium]